MNNENIKKILRQKLNEKFEELESFNENRKKLTLEKESFNKIKNALLKKIEIHYEKFLKIIEEINEIKKAMTPLELSEYEKEENKIALGSAVKINIGASSIAVEN